MNDLTTQKQEIVSIETLTRYLATFTGAGVLEENERQLFLEVARAYNLNPFKKEIYCIAYGEGKFRKLSLITGFEAYLKRAEATGLLDGWEVKTEGNGNDLKAVITIYRKDRKYAFIHEVFCSEYIQTDKDGKVNRFWKEKPRTMIKKVAMAQGFRLCFPLELGGMPYTADELPEEMTQEKPEQKPLKMSESEQLITIEDILKAENSDIEEFKAFYLTVDTKLSFEDFQKAFIKKSRTGLPEYRKFLESLRITQPDDLNDQIEPEPQQDEFPF